MNSRQVELYDILFDHDSFVTAKVLADQLKVTPKTIYLDVRKIEEEFAGTGLYIDRRPNQGLKLVGTPEAKREFANQIHKAEEQDTNELSLAARRRHIFTVTLMSGGSISLQDLSEQYFVSKTAILNDLDYFSRFMEPSHVRFETVNKRIEVIGEESDIQTVIVNYLLRLVSENRGNRNEVLKSYFDETFFSVVLKIYEESNLIDFSRMNDYYEESLLISFLVFIARIRKGKRQQHIVPSPGGSTQESYPLACDLCGLMTQRMDIEFESSDIDALTRLLFAHKAFPVTVENQSWGKIVDEVIDRLEQTVDVVLSDRSELRGQLLSHFPSMILRLRKGVKITNPLLQEIKTRHLLLFTASWYVLSPLEEKYNITLNDDEVSFIAAFFQMAVNKTIPSHNILVICPYGAVSSQILVRKLRQILPRNDDITSCGVSQLKSADFEDIDLIVTTASVYLDTPVPAVQVSPFLNDEDYAKIFESYSKYVFQKNRLLESLRLHKLELPSLKKYLRAEDLFFHQSMDSKEECLNFLIDHFEKRGYVTDGYRQSVFSREKDGNTGLENNVALPHGKPELCNEVAIGIVTLVRPVKWAENYYIDIIVLLSIPQRMESEFGDIVMDIYHLVENGDIVAEIKKLEQGDDFVSIISQ